MQEVISNPVLGDREFVKGKHWRHHCQGNPAGISETLTFLLHWKFACKCLIGIPIVILLPVCSKDKMLLSTVRSKVVFLAWWSSKEEFWLCQLCMSNAMGLISAFIFFSRHQITWLEPDSKKKLRHEQQDMQLNPHVPWEWSQPSQPLWKRLQWQPASIPWQKQTLLLPCCHHSSSWHWEMWPGDKSVWNWAEKLYWNTPALRFLDSRVMPALHRHWFLSQGRSKACTRCNFPSLMNFHC